MQNSIFNINKINQTKNIVLIVLYFAFVFSTLFSPLTVLGAETTFTTSLTTTGLTTLPPSIPSNLVATAVSHQQIDLSWTASVPNYYAVGGYRIFRDSIFIATTTSTSYSDTGLSPVTGYSYNVEAFDTLIQLSGQSATAYATTTSAPIPTPTPTSPPGGGGGGGGGGGTNTIEITNINIIPGTNQAEVRFTTSIAAQTKLQWGFTTDFEIGTQLNAFYGFEHSQIITGLSEGLTYKLRINANGANGASTYKDVSFTTVLPVAEVGPLPNPTNFVAEAKTDTIELTWINPTDPRFNDVRIVRTEGFYPIDQYDGIPLYEGDGESYTDTTAKPGVTYYYAIFSRDRDLNYSSGALAQARIALEGEIATPTIIDPFANIPQASNVDPMFKALRLSDFEFIQDGRNLAHVGETVAIHGDKNLTIRLQYNKVPKILKTIAFTLKDPTDANKVFPFLLRANADKTYYEATIGALGRSGRYGMSVAILDYENNGLVRLNGTLAALAFTPWIDFTNNFDLLGLLILFLLILLIILAIAMIRKWARNHPDYIHANKNPDRGFGGVNSKKAYVSIVVLIIINFAIFGINKAQAGINQQINYQGKLTNSLNAVVPNGSYNIRFKLYTTRTGGAPIWTETWCNTSDCAGTGIGTDDRITISNGLFSTMLGSTTALTGIDFNQTLYLGVEIGGSGAVASWDGEMSPRKILGAVPAAFVAEVANTLSGLNSSQFLRSDAQNATSSATTFINVMQSGAGKIAEFFGSASQSVLSILSNGNVGIGTSTPYSRLSVAGTVVADNFVATSTTASTFPYASSTALTVSGTNGLQLAGGLNGLLQAVNGLVSSTSTLSIGYGGTGLSTAPSYGQVLLGNSSGSYDLIGTSSLGIIANLSAVSGTLGVANGGTGANTFGQGWIYTNGGTGALNSSTSPTVNYITATSTTATSTFAGGMNVAGSTGLSVLQNGNVGVGTKSPTARLMVSGGVISTIYTVEDPSSVYSSVQYDNSYVYIDEEVNYSVLSYRTVNGTKFYSAGNAGNISDNSSTNFGVDISWDPGVNAEGYVVKVNNYYIDVGNVTQIFDDGSHSGWIFGNFIPPETSPHYEITPDTNFSLFDVQVQGVSKFIVSALGNVGIGTSSPFAKLSVAGAGSFDNYVRASYFTATSTTASTFLYASSTALTVSGTNGLQLASGLNGPLQAVNGLVSSTSTLSIGYGGTGLSTAPSYGQLLLGNALGGYTLTSTSSLGIASGWDAFSDISLTKGHFIVGDDSGLAQATSSLFVSSVGNVGIGSTSPTSKLVLNGGNFTHTASGNPTSVGTYDTSGDANQVYVSGKYAYVADGASGLQIIDISNLSSPTLVGTYDTNSASGVYVSGRFAYVGDAAFGLQIIDISNPSSPTLAGTYDTSGSASQVYVSGKYAYVADGASGLQIIDISNPSSPTLVGTFGSVLSISGVYVFGKYAYLADDTSGLQIIDISNPSTPTLAGTYNTGGFSKRVYVSGKYAYVADSFSGLQIIDVSNPSTPTLAGTYNTSGNAWSVYISGKYAYVADGAPGLHIIDISNPSSPTLVGTYDTSGTANGIYISGKYAYVADGASGLQIIDINGIETPSLYAGNIETNVLNVTENADIANNLLVRNGLNVGVGGIFTDGSLSVTGTTSSYIAYNLGIGTTSPFATLSVAGIGSFDNYVRASYFIATSTTATSTFPNLSLTNLLFGSDYLTDITGSGLSIVNNALTVAGISSSTLANTFATFDSSGNLIGSSTVSISYGGTGLSTAPSYGQVLLGNSSGSYDLIGTSSLGIIANLSSVSGTLGVANGGTGATTFSQGWIYTNGGTGALNSSTSPTVNYITATSTTATSTFAGGLSVAGSTGLNVLQDGKVGVGTASPLGSLDISSGNVAIYLGANGSSNARTHNTQKIGRVISAQYSNNANGATVFIANNTSSSNDLYIGGGSASYNAVTGINFYTGANTGTAQGTIRMAIDNAGNVGVGSTTPWAQLSVNPSGITGPSFAIGSSTATKFIVTNGGNVGIGTSDPGLYQLYVSGSGSAYFGSHVQSSGNFLSINGGAVGAEAFGYNGGGGMYFPAANTVAFNTSAKEALRISSTGNVGIGTTSPYAKLSVVGETVSEYFTATSTTATSTFPNILATNLRLTGSLYDSTNSTGANGYVLQSNGTTAQWVSTSSLNIAGGSGLSGGTAGMLASWTGASTLTATGTPTAASYFATSTTATSTFLGGLTVVGSTGLNVLQNGKVGIGTNNPMTALEVIGDITSKGTSWTARSAVGNDDYWRGVVYGNGLFVAVGYSGDFVMTSPDGINWTARSAAGDNDVWMDVTYGNGLFVAVSNSGDRVMTSPDGINWTARSAAGNNDNWRGVTYGNGLFVAVSNSGDRVMTSPDGINWTARSAAGNDDEWYSVTYGNGLFVAVGADVGDRVMTSPDGINWTPQSALGNNDGWLDIVYGNGLFVAIGSGPDKVMISSDGVNWTASDDAGTFNSWNSITYGNGLFVVAGASGADRVMTSPDGINWTARSAAGNDDDWYGTAYGNGVFVIVGTFGDLVMTSGKIEETVLVHNNLYQGGMNIIGNVGIGTTSPFATLSVAGIGSFDNYVRASYFIATSTTATSTFPNLSLTNLLFGSDYLTDITGSGLSIINNALTVTGISSSTLANTLASFDSVGNLIGSSTLSISYGGTGLSTAPSYGQVLLGNASGGYTLTSTTSLGISAGWDALSDISLTKGYFVVGDDAGLAQATSSLFVSSVGNVGIGSTSPYAKLSIQSPLAGTTELFSVSTSSRFSTLMSWPSASTTPNEYVKVASGGNSIFTGKVLNPTIVGGKKDDSLLAGARSVFVSGKYAYVANGTDPSLRIINIASTTSPYIVGGIKNASLLNGIYDVYVSGDYAYVVNSQDDSLRIVDVSNPASPSIVGGVKDASQLDSPRAVVVSGKYAYVVNYSDNSLRIVDVSNPVSPKIIGGVKDASLLNGPNSVFVQGKYAYVGNIIDNSLRIIDISNPTAPFIVGGVKDLAKLDGINSVYVSGNYAYVTDYNERAFRVIDVSNPTSPSIIGNIVNTTLFNNIQSVHVAGKYAYIVSTDSDYFAVVDISNPTSPLIVSAITNSSLLNGATSVFVSGQYAYVANSTDNSLRIIDIGAVEVSNLYAGNLETDTLSVTGFAQLNQGLSVRGGINGDSLNIKGFGSFTLATSTSYSSTHANPLTALTASVLDANTSGISNVSSLFHGGYASTSVGVNGIGTGLAFASIDANGSATSTGQIASIFTNTSVSTPASALSFSIKNISGSLFEAFRIDSTGNVGIGTTSPYAKLSVVGEIVSAYFTATTTTASTFPYASTTALTVSGTNGLQLASGLNGPLQALNGLVSSTSTLSIGYGGTGLSTAPAYGQVLLGNASGGYTLTSTSSLGISAGAGWDALSDISLTKGYFVVGDDAGLAQATSSLFVSSTGNIGIGSTTPYAKLSVVAPSSMFWSSTTPNMSIFSVASSSRESALYGYATSTPNEYFRIAAGGDAFLTGKVLNPTFLAETLGPTPSTSLNSATSVFVSGKYAYVANQTQDSLAVIDISNPNSPTFFAETQGPTPGTSLDGANSVFVSGKYAYVANNVRDSLAVIDISNPKVPTFVSETRGPTPGTSLDGAYGVFVSGKYAYVANYTRDSLAVIDISNPAVPTFVAETRGPTPGTSLNGAYSVYVSGKYAYLVSQNRSAIAVIDISNPSSPTFVAETLGPVAGTTLSGASSVFVSGKYAYVSNYSRGSLAVIDISNPSSPTFVAETLGPTPGTSLAGANSVFVSGKYAYVANANRRSLAVIDISNPVVPTFVAETRGDTPGTSLNGAASVFISGKYAYVANINRDSLAVIDVGGAEVSNLYAGGIETDNLQVNAFAQLNQGLLVRGGINADGGIFSQGQGVFTVASSTNFSTLNASTSLPFAVLSANIIDTNSSSITDALSLSHGAWSASANNIGVGIGFALEAADGFATSTGRIASIMTGTSVSAPTSALTFSIKNSNTGLSEALRIDSTGYVGIGTTSPISRLNIVGTGINSSLILTDSSYGTDNHKNISLGSDTGIFKVLATDYTKTSTTSLMQISADYYGNIAFGNSAMANNITAGSNNVAIGNGVLDSNVSGNNNTGIGWGSLGNNTSGINNVAIGGWQVAIGTLGTNTTGSNNIAFGTGSLGANSIGSSNIAFGYGSLWSNQWSSYNVAIGQSALSSNTATGSIAIGYQAGDNLETGSYNIAIGHDVDFPSTSASGQLTIGNLIFGTGLDGTGTTLSTGNIGIGTSSPFAKLSVAGIGSFDNYVRASYFTATSTTASTFPYASTTALTVSGTNGLQLSSGLNGPLQAVNGLVSSTSTLSISYGGTGTSTAPTYGKILLGNNNGGYDLTSTSSLGILASSAIGLGNQGFIPYYAASEQALTATSSVFLAQNSFVGIGTTTPTSALSVFSASAPQFQLAYNKDNYLTAGVSSSGGVTLAVNGTAGGLTITNPQPTAVVSGTGTAAPNSLQVNGATGGNSLDTNIGVGGIGGGIQFTAGIGGTALLATFSETGGAGGAVAVTGGIGGAASSPSIDFMTRVAGQGGQLTFAGGAGGDASNGGLSSSNTAGAGGRFVLKGGIGGNASGATSNTGGNGGSLYIAGGAGGTGSTANGSSGDVYLGYDSSSSIGNVYFGNQNVSYIGSTGNFGIGTTTPVQKLSVQGSALISGNVSLASLIATGTVTLSGTSQGIAAIGTNGILYTYATTTATNFAYPFALTGNATSTLTQFNGGLTAYASSTIGNGTQAGGLTISGGATTTGNSYVVGTLSTGRVIIDGGSIDMDGSSIYAGNYYDQAGFWRVSPSNSSVAAILNGSVGIGTSTPYAKLSVVGETVSEYFTSTSTTATSTFPNILATNLRLTGSLYDSTNSAGANGYVLQSNGTTAQWVSTSSLNITGGSGWDALSDISLNKGYFVVGDDAGLAQATSSLFVSSTGNIGIGSTTPYAKLSVVASPSMFWSSTTPNTSIFSVASSSRASTLYGYATSTPNEYFRIAAGGDAFLTGKVLNPTILAETRGPTPGTSLNGATSVFVSGKYAYVANSARHSLAVIDISNPNSPSFVAETLGPVPGTSLNYAASVFVSGKYAYVANYTRASLAVIDISNPAVPTFVAETRGPTPGTSLNGAFSVFVSGKYAYVANNTRDSLAVIDISNPAVPTFVAETLGPTPGTSLNGAGSVYVSGNYAYVANFTRDSLAVIDISNPSSPTFVAETQGPVAGTSLDGARSVFVSGKYAYVANQGRDSVAVINISNPAAPTFVAETQGPTPGDSLNDITSIFLSGKYVYATNATRSSLAIIDISNPAVPTFVAEERGPNFGELLGNAASVFVSGKYAYVANSSRDSLAVIDVGGAEVSNLYAGGIETDNLQVNAFAQLNQGLLVRGGINADGGIFSQGQGVFTVASSTNFSTLNASTSLPFAVLSANIIDTNSSSITDALSLSHGAWSASANNIGVGIGFALEAADGFATSTGRIASIMTGTTLASPTSALTFSIKNSNTGLTEALRIDSTGNIGIGTTSPWAKLSVGAHNGGTNPLFAIASSSTGVATSTLFVVNQIGNVGIGTTTPYAKLSVVGETVSEYFTATSTTATSTFPNILATNLRLTGSLYDSTNSTGANGYVLQSNGTTAQWVSTSSLNIAGGSGLSGGTAGMLASWTGALTLTATGTPTAASYFASSTTATSTFAGGMNITGSGLQISSNTRIYQNGFSFLYSSTSPSGNLTVGYQSAPSLDENGGLYSTFIGQRSGATATSSYGNTAVGYESLANVTAGTQSVSYDDGLLVTEGGIENVAMGDFALAANTYGFRNVGIGSGVLTANTTGFYNIGIGASALGFNETGYSNIGIGVSSLNYLDGGNNNISIGDSALKNLLTGSSNIAIGSMALEMHESGDENIVIGDEVMRASTSGSASSTIIGTRAASLLDGGVANTFLGYQSGTNVTSGSYNILIGQNVEAPSATVDGQLNIGNVLYGSGMYDGVASSPSPTSLGRIGVGSTTPWAQLSINPNGLTGPTFAIGSSTATKFIVDNGGNVGINTSAPNSKLNVKGEGLTTGRSFAVLNSSNADKFVVLDSGNVRLGAGANAAATKLEVIGSDSSGSVGTEDEIKLIRPLLALEYPKVAAFKLGKWNSGTLTSSSQLDIALKSGANSTYDADATIMSLLSDRRVGIGSTSPFATLSVAGFGSFDNYVRASYFTATSTTAASTFPYASTTALTVSGALYNTSLADGCLNVTSGLIGSTGSACGAGSPSAGGGVGWATSTDAGNLESIYYTGLSNVGVGTTSPYSILSISNKASTAVNTPLFTIASTTAGNSTTTLMTVLANGNVGIGTANPTSLLYANSPSGGKPLMTFDSAGSTRFSVTEYGTITFAGVSYGSFGTAASPTYTFNSRSTDGMYSPASNILGFSTNGTEKLRISSAGNVGIGTSTPSAKLSIHANNGETNTSLFTIASSTGSATTTLFTVLNSGRVGIGKTPGAAYELDVEGDVNVTGGINGSSHITMDNTAAGFRMRGGLSVMSSPADGKFYFSDSTFTGNGTIVANNMGLGTTTPYSILSISNSASTAVNTPLFTIASTTAGNSTTTLMTVLANGNVGIGMTNPEAALDVSGSTNGTVKAKFLQTTLSGSILTGSVTIGTGVFTGATSITTTGNVGIGSTTPWAQLSVNPNGIAGPAFAIGSSTKTDFIVTNAGNVGIGTISPGKKFDVVFEDDTSGAGVTFRNSDGSMEFTNNSGTAGNFAPMWKTNSNGSTANPAMLFWGNAPTGSDSGTAPLVYLRGSVNNAAASVRPVFGVYNYTSPLMTVSSSGNVGIGTTSPYAKLSVVGETVSTYFTATSTIATSTFAGGLNVGQGNLVYDFTTGITSVNALETGNLNFETDAGAVSWADLPISSAPLNSVQSYTAQIGGTGVLTIFGLSNGSGGVATTSVAIGTSTPYTAGLTVWGRDTLSSTRVVDVVNNASTSLLTIYNGGAVAIGGSTSTTTINGYLDILGTGTNSTSTISSNLWVKGTLRSNLSYVGDLVFANNFTFTEALPINSTSTQGLYLNNQNGERVLAIDDQGNLNITGDICANNLVCFNESLDKLSEDVGSLASSTAGLAGVAENVNKTSSSVQTLADSIVALDLKVDAFIASSTSNIDSIIASTTLAFASSTDLMNIVASSTANALTSNDSFIQSIANSVKNILASTQDWVVERFTAKVAYVNRVEAETVAISKGMEIVDQTTGSVWCVTIKNGDWNKVQGTCSAVASTTPAVPEITPTASILPTPTPSIIPVISTPATSSPDSNASSTATTTTPVTSGGGNGGEINPSPSPLPVTSVSPEASPEPVQSPVVTSDPSPTSTPAPVEPAPSSAPAPSEAPAPVESPSPDPLPAESSTSGQSSSTITE